MKIFVTVGTQLPFDRMVQAVDDWVGRTSGAEAFAQIGPSKYHPRHMRWRPFIDALECRRRVQESDAVVAHAGMGSIITAMELCKPIIVVPRRAALGEHRNEHQLATVQRLAAQGRIKVAYEAEALPELLAAIEKNGVPSARIERHASERLIHKLQAFLLAPAPIDALSTQPGQLGLPADLPAGVAHLEPV